MSDLTHDHLDALATRLETSYRRECDQVRDDIADLKSIVRIQNGRIGNAACRGAAVGGATGGGEGMAGGVASSLLIRALLSPRTTSRAALGLTAPVVERALAQMPRAAVYSMLETLQKRHPDQPDK